MSWFARWLLVIVGLGPSSDALGQVSPSGWSYPEWTVAKQDVLLPPVPPGVAGPIPVVPPNPIPVVPPNPIPTGLPERPPPLPDLPPLPPPESGQQHWVSLNLTVLQPFTGRIGVKVWPRANDSVWVEAYLGSVLFGEMYGFGVRVQHTAVTFRNGDRLMLSPGVGVHVLSYWDFNQNSVSYVFGDVDVSWLHDFSPHFGYEMGIKLGVAGRVGGHLDSYYPRFLTWGRDFYPIFSIYSGFRF